MEYEMEELAAVVGELARKYTACESTSITYEKARQLMEAVLYSIRETGRSDGKSVVPAEGMSAWKAYEAGVKVIEEKTGEALALYNRLLPDFAHYGNRCLWDTFARGLPEFFKWYDVRFAPQETILTLDYPVLKDLSQYAGIHKIYEFLVCIQLEQRFLRAFPEGYVIHVLQEYNRQYKDMVDNLCEILYACAAAHMLVQKPISEELESKDWGHIGELLGAGGPEKIKARIKEETERLVKRYWEEDEGLTEYLFGSADGILVRMKNRVKVHLGAAADELAPKVYTASYN